MHAIIYLLASHACPLLKSVSRLDQNNNNGRESIGTTIALPIDGWHTAGASPCALAKSSSLSRMLSENNIETRFLQRRFPVAFRCPNHDVCLGGKVRETAPNVPSTAFPGWSITLKRPGAFETHVPPRERSLPRMALLDIPHAAYTYHRQ